MLVNDPQIQGLQQIPLMEWIVCIAPQMNKVDGTAPDFGPSKGPLCNPWFEMVIWKGIHALIQRQSFNFQILHFFGCLTESEAGTQLTMS